MSTARGHAPQSEILVGLGDPVAAPVVAAGLTLAETRGARTRFLHAVRLPAWMDFDVSAEARALHTASLLGEAHERIAAQLGAVFRDLDHAGDPDELLGVHPGPAGEVLRAAVGNAREALLVIGPHARRGVVDFGRTARHVLSRPRCDVWTQLGEWSPPESLLAAVDFSECSERALRSAVRLAADFGARLLVLHVLETPTVLAPSPAGLPLTAGAWLPDSRKAAHRAFEELLDRTDWGDVPYESMLLEGKPASRILALVPSVDAVVCGSHGRSALASTLLGSVAYEVLRSADRPVLTVRPEGR